MWPNVPPFFRVGEFILFICVGIDETLALPLGSYFMLYAVYAPPFISLLHILGNLDQDTHSFLSPLIRKSYILTLFLIIVPGIPKY